MARKKKQSGKKTTRRRRWLISAGIVLALLAAVGAWVLVPFWQLAGHFEASVLLDQPSRLYAEPLVVEPGAAISRERVEAELEAAGYSPAAADEGALAPGRYRSSRGRLEAHLRRFPTPDGPDAGGGVPVEIAWDGRRIASVEAGGKRAAGVALEPPILESYFDERMIERRPVALDELPEHVVEAVLAAEDAAFFKHQGVSIPGILRAAWVNARRGGVTQGGSTLTQQLVKNVYLTHERTWSRKIREAVLSVLLEIRYPKRDILQAYLNEIYLGASNGANLMGVGAAARAYFGKDVRDLDLAEAATLAGIIRSPANLAPTADPTLARKMRDRVLGRMLEQEWIEADRVERIRARPVVAAPARVPRRRAPWFAVAAAEEAARRYGVEPLEAAGYSLFSTLSWSDQQAAQEAVGWGVEALESGWQKGARVSVPLEAALASLDAEGGGIRAYVGGRDFRRSQFDRAGQAMRQVGSAFKPVVYAAAFEQGLASPSTLVEDAPLSVRLAGRRWTPENSSGEYHGWVTARTALEESLNTATARLALNAGLDRIVELARRMGFASPLQAVPAVALGAFEATPLEMATVYATLAAGGVRPPVHAVEGILDAEGSPVAGNPLPAPQRVMTRQTAFLLTSVLQGVLDHGTAASARTMGLRDDLAGKTGTSNERRDSWFVGYSPERSTAVWVGYDDNSATRMGGARAALPIWTRFVVAVRPPGGYAPFRVPPGVTTAVVDPETGGLATDRCPTIVTEYFAVDRVPERLCHLHRGFWADPVDQPSEEVEEPRRKRGGFKRWLKRVFGDG